MTNVLVDNMLLCVSKEVGRRFSIPRRQRRLLIPTPTLAALSRDSVQNVSNFDPNIFPQDNHILQNLRFDVSQAFRSLDPHNPNLVFKYDPTGSFSSVLLSSDKCSDNSSYIAHNHPAASSWILLHTDKDVCDMVIAHKKLVSKENPPLAIFVDYQSPKSKALYNADVNHLDKKLLRTTNGSVKYRCTSFYKFTVIADPVSFSQKLYQCLSYFSVRGRVYVAHEGINAQVALPLQFYHELYDELLRRFPMLTGIVFNFDVDIDVQKQLVEGDTTTNITTTTTAANTTEDHHLDEVKQENQDLDGTPSSEFHSLPFKKLQVKVRKQILTDGFFAGDSSDVNNSSIDWCNVEKSGKEMSPHDWHLFLSDQTKDKVVLDCRNFYESDVGIFKNAIPLNTVSFQDTWDKLSDIVTENPKAGRDTPILMYCTGGIRCNKVAAFLNQKLDRDNVYRLKGGIISYQKYLEQHNIDAERESTFRGANFVFDGRMQNKVTSDTLATCKFCGDSCDSYVNCDNAKCHALYLRCRKCVKHLKNYCSDKCMASAKANLFERDTASERDRYALALSSSFSSSSPSSSSSADPSVVLQSIQKHTKTQFPHCADQISNPLQGKILTMMAQMCRPRRILEIGTFTGFAAVSLAIGGSDSLVSLDTVEIDQERVNFTKKMLSNTQLKEKINIVHSSGEIFLQSCQESYDMIFLDANKGAYPWYYERIMSTSVLKQNGWLIIDNVLFGGRVTKYVTMTKHHEMDQKSIGKYDDSNDIRKYLYSEKKVRERHEFNMIVRDDPRSETVLLPFRDGMTVVRKLVATNKSTTN